MSRLPISVDVSEMHTTAPTPPLFLVPIYEYCGGRLFVNAPTFSAALEVF
ncbi:hypothetical protein PHLCEN_2v2300 [Hermanssonia centrifuga]|uniref:Uncharacterized protein n=1 Tax=Hermanssonia centrifuga TaxID=98765 RepID=A0A2R6RPI4_9APHY|nr:hypothetical protein PHLCEN_2v2300 [Hermanssonia centrifuga]